MASYDKPYLSPEQQVRLLAARGMAIADEKQAILHLSRIGYYRLSAYWHPYKLRESGKDGPTAESFRPGTRFEDVLALYDYDSRLRRLVLEGVEIVEISLRTRIADLLGARDPFAYMKPEHLHGVFRKPDSGGKTQHQRWMEGYQEKMHRAGEVFTEHLIAKYGLPLPIWAAVELWELNQLCFFLSGLKHDDKLALSRIYGLNNGELLVSWMGVIKRVRNHAAHHGRIWNRNLSKQPRLPEPGAIPELDFIIQDPGRVRQARCCCPLILMAHMINKVAPESSWLSALNATIADFPAHTGMSHVQMGFPEKWAGYGRQKRA